MSHRLVERLTRVRPYATGHHARRRHMRYLAASLWLLSTPVLALDVAAPTGLGPLPDAIAASHSPHNPYRGATDAREQVLAVGATAYAQACARCHGAEAMPPAPAADLRIIGRYCNRLGDPALRARCLDDADAYFLKTVKEGKVRLDIRHMPAWKHLLSERQIWAIQLYTESRR